MISIYSANSTSFFSFRFFKIEDVNFLDNEELNALLTTIHNQELEIKELQKELRKVIGSNEELLIEKTVKNDVLNTMLKNKKK